jgi:hypothetical protein
MQSTLPPSLPLDRSWRCGKQRTWGLTLVRVGPVANHLSLVRIRMCVTRARRHPPQRGCHAQPSTHRTPALLRHQLRPLSRWVHRSYVQARSCRCGGPPSYSQQVRGAVSTCPGNARAVPQCNAGAGYGGGGERAEVYPRRRPRAIQSSTQHASAQHRFCHLARLAWANTSCSRATSQTALRAHDNRGT